MHELSLSTPEPMLRLSMSIWAISSELGQMKRILMLSESGVALSQQQASVLPRQQKSALLRRRPCTVPQQGTTFLREQRSILPRQEPMFSHQRSVKSTYCH